MSLLSSNSNLCRFRFQSKYTIRQSPPRQTSIGQPPPLPAGPQRKRAMAFRPAPRPKGKIDIKLIGDSLATNLIGPRFEAATGSLLRRTKAYAAQEDEIPGQGGEQGDKKDEEASRLPSPTRRCTAPEINPSLLSPSLLEPTQASMST